MRPRFGSSGGTHYPPHAHQCAHTVRTSTSPSPRCVCLCTACAPCPALTQIRLRLRCPIVLTRHFPATLSQAAGALVGCGFPMLCARAALSPMQANGKRASGCRSWLALSQRRPAAPRLLDTLPRPAPCTTPDRDRGSTWSASGSWPLAWSRSPARRSRHRTAPGT